MDKKLDTPKEKWTRRDSNFFRFFFVVASILITPLLGVIGQMVPGFWFIGGPAIIAFAYYLPASIAFYTVVCIAVYAPWRVNLFRCMLAFCSALTFFVVQDFKYTGGVDLTLGSIVEILTVFGPLQVYLLLVSACALVFCSASISIYERVYPETKKYR